MKNDKDKVKRSIKRGRPNKRNKTNKRPKNKSKQKVGNRPGDKRRSRKKSIQKGGALLPAIGVGLIATSVAAAAYKGFRLINKIKDIQKKLQNNLPTIPSTIKEELECNIFLRSDNIETFSKLRDLKDNF